MKMNYTLHELLSEHADEIVQEPNLAAIFYLLENKKIPDIELDIVDFAEGALKMSEETAAETQERLSFQKKTTSIMQSLSQKALDMAREFQKDPKKHVGTIKKAAQIGSMALGNDSKLGQFLRMIVDAARKLKESNQLKSFKELRKTISEHTGLGVGSFDLSGFAHARVGPMDSPSQGQDFNQNISQLHPAQMDRINTFLGALAAKPYLDPHQALREIQTKLSTVGLTFQIHDGPTLRSMGTHMYPLSLFGGSFGADGSTYGYKPADDNIERRLGHKLCLLVTSMPTSTGMTSLKARLAPM